MYVCISYDFACEKRRKTFRKLLKPYLHPTQYSFWEGYLTKAQFNLLLKKIPTLIDPSEDRIVLFVNNYYFKRFAFGKTSNTPIQKALLL